MGLLDMNEDQSNLMMGLGMGLLSASAPSSTRKSFGQTMLGGLQGFQQAAGHNKQRQVDAMQQQMMQMQMERYMQEQQQAKQRQEEIARILPTLPESERTAISLGVPMTDIWKHNNPADVKPQLVTVSTPDGPVQRWVKPGETSGVDVGAPADKESALPWYVKKGANGEMMIDPAYSDLERTKASFARPPAQPKQPVAYVDGAGNTVWGTIDDARGKGAANFSPVIQGALAGAKEVAKVTAKTQTEAAFDAPRVVQAAETAIKHVDDLLAHPGFSQAVGKSSMFGVQKVPGTEGYDFMNRLDQVKGGAFLEAFNQLKGGGQITEVEGKKATDALARMNNATSEFEFKAAANDFKTTVRLGMDRAKMKAGNKQPATPSPGGAKFLGFE